MKKIFILTEIIIPAIVSAVVVWFASDAFDKWEDRKNERK